MPRTKITKKIVRIPKNGYATKSARKNYDTIE